MNSNTLRTTVISPLGFVMDIILPITNVADILTHQDSLTQEGFKPWPGDTTNPLDPVPIEDEDTQPLDPVLDPAESPSFAEADFCHKRSDDIPWPEDPPEDENTDEPPAITKSGTRPRLLQANIISFKVDEIKKGGNRGDPFWRIKTDDDRDICIFDLDVLVREYYITREDAMTTWREIGKKFVADKLPATFRLQVNGYYDLTCVKPTIVHQTKIRGADTPTFEPKDVLIISDIVNTDGNKLSGKTENLDTVHIVNKDLPHFAAVGHDISTFTHAEPHVRQPIPVILKDGYIKYVQATTGAWTQAKHVAQLQRGDVLYLADEEQPCHTIKGVRKSIGNGRYVTFEDEHQALSLQGTQYIALTLPETEPPAGVENGEAVSPVSGSDSDATMTSTEAGVPKEYIPPPMHDALLADAGA